MSPPPSKDRYITRPNLELADVKRRHANRENKYCTREVEEWYYKPILGLGDRVLSCSRSQKSLISPGFFAQQRQFSPRLNRLHSNYSLERRLYVPGYQPKKQTRPMSFCSGDNIYITLKNITYVHNYDSAKSFEICELADKELVNCLVAHENVLVQSINVDELEASVESFLKIRIYDLAAGRPILVCSRRALSEINIFEHVAQSSVYIIGLVDGGVTFMDTRQRTFHRPIKAHSGAVLGLSTDHEHYFTTSSADGTVKVWDARRLPLPVVTPYNGGSEIRAIKIHPDKPGILAYAENGLWKSRNQVRTASNLVRSASLFIYDYTKGERLSRIDCGSPVSSLQFLPNQKANVLTTHWDSQPSMNFWIMDPYDNLLINKPVNTINDIRERKIFCSALNKNGSLLATLSGSHNIESLSFWSKDRPDRAVPTRKKCFSSKNLPIIR